MFFPMLFVFLGIFYINNVPVRSAASSTEEVDPKLKLYKPRDI